MADRADRPVRIVAACAGVTVANYRPSDGPSIAAAVTSALRGAFAAASASPASTVKARGR